MDVSTSLFPLCPCCPWPGRVDAEKESVSSINTDCMRVSGSVTATLFTAEEDAKVVTWLMPGVDVDVTALPSEAEGIGGKGPSDKESGKGAGRGRLIDRGGRDEIPTAISPLSGRSCKIGIVGEISPLTPRFASS